MHKRQLGLAVRNVGLAVLLIKVYALVVFYVLFLRTDLNQDYSAFLFLKEGQSRKERLTEIRTSFIERLAPYDGQFYLDIAANGYRRFEQTLKNFRELRGPEGNYAFFPLLPFFLRALRADESRVALGAALFLNVVLATAACVALWLLAKNLAIPAWLTVAFLLSYPAAAFQCVLYGESLFLFLSVALALALHGHRRGAASFLGYLGGLCRPQGVLLGALALWRGRSERRAWLRFLTVLAPVAGIASFAVSLAEVIGSPFGFVEIQGSWGREFSLATPLRELFDLSQSAAAPLDRLGILLGVGLLPFLWRYLPRSFALYGTATVVLPLLSGSILSFGRFLSVSFPHFLCLAKIFENWRVASVVLIAGFAMLQTVLARGLIGWHFVG